MNKLPDEIWAREVHNKRKFEIIEMDYHIKYVRADIVDQLRETLEWYGERARLARLIHSEGDKGRNDLAADGGHLARRALAD